MEAQRRPLTELEGAVLTEIGFRGNCTAFKVRRAFQLSPCVDWSGSAGAVYPAIRRLTEAGLILAEPGPGRRRTLLLSLSAEGEAALQAWCRDAGAATAIGSDPFRLRSGLWKTLPGPRRAETVRALRAALEAGIAALEARVGLDLVDRSQTELALELQRLRLRWLDTLGPAESGEDSEPKI